MFILVSFCISTGCWVSSCMLSGLYVSGMNSSSHSLVSLLIITWLCWFPRSKLLHLCYWLSSHFHNSTLGFKVCTYKDATITEIKIFINKSLLIKQWFLTKDVPKTQSTFIKILTHLTHLTQDVENWQELQNVNGSGGHWGRHGQL